MELTIKNCREVFVARIKELDEIIDGTIDKRKKAFLIETKEANERFLTIVNSPKKRRYLYLK